MRQVGVQIAASPEGKRRLAESNSNAEHNERRRLNLASLNLDPAFRQKISEHLTSAKHRQHLRKIVDDPAFRQSQQQRMQTLWDAVRAAGCRTFAEYKALETGGTAQAGK